MSRGLKILAAVLVALLVLAALNTVVTGRETKAAEVTVPDGRILRLGGEELQLVEGGPRDGRPIVLLHCFTCAIDWWDGVRPRLERDHRVVAIDLLGHGGSSKPDSGYSIPEQAEAVAGVLARLGVVHATVAGHSLGGSVAVALAERSPEIVDRIAIIDEPSTLDEGDLGFVASLGFTPVIGDAFWRLKPDFAVRDGLEIAFAPGFEVPDSFVEDVKRMTYTSYDDTPSALEDFLDERPLAERAASTGKPLMVLMGAEEQIVDDPRAALRSYSAQVPGAVTRLVTGAGHSPNVERPDLTAGLLLGFAAGPGADGGRGRMEPRSEQASRRPMQDRVQNREAVRKAP